MGVDAVRVKAVRPRICTICRRRINTGDFYDRYTETDEFGVRQIHKSCLEHDDDDPEDSTATRLLKRVHVDHLKKTHPTGGVFANEDVPPMPLDQAPQTVDTERRVGWDSVPDELKQHRAESREANEIASLAMDLWLAGPKREKPLDECSKLAVELHKRGWRKDA